MKNKETEFRYMKNAKLIHNHYVLNIPSLSEYMMTTDKIYQKEGFSKAYWDESECRRIPRDVILFEIAYQLKRIGDFLEEKR